MEAKFLAGAFSFLSIFLAIYAQSSVNYETLGSSSSNDDPGDEEGPKFELETAIYYGDSEVHLGQEFSITCIVPITDPILWLKDGEPIKHHNLRHGRDEHSYNISENYIEGEKHKIEARISVRHALNAHAGKYQCNTLHTSYHVLRVLPPKEGSRPQTKSPFLMNALDLPGGVEKQHLPTESVFETAYDLQPRPQPDDTLTRTWETPVARPGDWAGQGSSMPPAQSVTPPHHRSHHHHQQQQQQQQKDKHKFIYINATNFDGSPRQPGGHSAMRPPPGEVPLLNFEYIQPTPKYPEYSTTNTWSQAPAGTGYGGGNNFFTSTMGHNKHGQQRPVYEDPYTTTALLPPTLIAGKTLTPPPGEHTRPTYYYTPQQPHQIPPTPRVVTYEPRGFQSVPVVTQPSQHQVQSHRPYQQYTEAGPVAAGPAGFSLAPWQAAGQPATTTIAASSTTAISKDLPFLVPNYDNATAQIKAYDIRTPLVLSCNITQPGDYTLTWQKNGTDVAKVPQLSGRYRILPKENKFIIERTDVDDDGPYSCSANNQSRIINVVARVVVRVPSNTGVVEGEKLTIVCTVVGTRPRLLWKIGNLTITETTGRYVLKPDDNKIENAILTVENVSLEDRGEFECQGSNEANDYTNHTAAYDVSYVRVKGKLAALWPFLGICAEVLVLCTIILIYEKRRNKTELEESDTDPQEQKKKRRNYD